MAATRSGDLTEVQREAAMKSNAGTESLTREIRAISLRDFERRRAEISEELWAAATEVGFFQIVDHGIELSVVDEAFEMSQKFFALPASAKRAYAHDQARNVGWEYATQVRPSTGTPDQKESYQITATRMDGVWPSEDEVSGFRATFEQFEPKCWSVAMQILSCFAEKLGFEREFFTQAHNRALRTNQSTMRLLHYFALSDEAAHDKSLWRAGAHTDFGNLTLLFQRAGQDGLQVLPGTEVAEQAWTPVAAANEAITCNIGDMLMRWSDDRLKSNFHRVRMPRCGEHLGDRYSIAYFTQADSDVVIAGPRGAYPAITVAEYMAQRFAANYAKV